MKKLKKRENQLLSMRLDILNPVFGEMWNRFEPMVFDEDAESVELEICNNNFRLVANPEVWKKYKHDKKLFVICHELCHVMFGHWLINPKMDREWCNIAQDIQVNQFLFKWYFKEKDIGKDMATVKTVFKHKAKMVYTNKDYTYYYDILMKCTS
jgi:hypothetical protein